MTTIGESSDSRAESGSQRRLHELCRLRSTLESFAVKIWRKSRGRARTVRELERLLGELRMHASRGNYDAFHKTDQAFHRAAVSAAELEPLIRSWEIVAGELYDWTLNVKRNFWPNLMALYREHALLLEVWQSADDGLVEQATHLHLEAGWSRSKMAGRQGGIDLDPLERAVSFMATHFASPLNVTWLARQVSFVSVSQLSRLFRAKLDCTPIRYLKQVRLERAAQLLRSTHDSISSIARQVGYRNNSHFVRDFRSMFRATPLRYRKSMHR